MPPLVSILIPAYNAERWLGETMKSALAQTWPKMEVIVVDDGSTDGTFQLARSFESRTCKVIAQTNAGAAAARNKALTLAQGEYIQWLDADDLLAPDKIERQLRWSDRGNAPLTLLSSSFGKFYYRQEKARFHATSLWQDKKPVEWFLAKFNDDASMILPAWLVSRLLTEKAGPWDERLTLDDDGEYFARVVACSQEVRFVPGAKSYYRQVNTASVSRTVNHRTCRSLFTSYRLCIGYLLAMENSGRTNAAALRFLQNNLIYFYPEEAEILVELDTLAHRLGGSLSPPRTGEQVPADQEAFRMAGRKELGFRASSIQAEHADDL